MPQLPQTKVTLRLEITTSNADAIAEFRKFWDPTAEAAWSGLEKNEELDTTNQNDALQKALDIDVRQTFANRIAKDLSRVFNRTVDPSEIVDLTALSQESWNPISSLHEGIGKASITLSSSESSPWYLFVPGQKTSIVVNVCARCTKIIR